jgi:tryptophan synthase alpha chain
MSRISQYLNNLKRQGRKALIPYITSGDPDAQTTIGVMHALVAQGADIIELGFPFSDPSSDGPVIQRAVERALAGKMTLRKTLDIVRQFREKNQTTPVVLMGYLNPIEFMGYEIFCNKAIEAGVDGVLIVDMPPEESHNLHQVLKKTALDNIFLIAPTTTPERTKTICEQSSGYIYYVSLKGVTGAAHLDIDSVASKLAKLRENTELPIGVGFGIRDAASAKRIAEFADAVVVGSALVQRVGELRAGVIHSDEQLVQTCALIGEIREALDSIRQVK